MKIPGENPPSFEESIALNTPMSPQEAVEKLASFHSTSADVITNSAFINLRGFNDGTVEFKEGISNGQRCIVMRGFRPNSTLQSWDHLIDAKTGRPIPRTG